MIPPFPPAPYVPMPPVRPPARRMGIRMSGCERPLEDILRQHIPMYPADHIYTVVEVGSAGCTTLRAFRDIVSEARGTDRWRVIGFDLTEDKAWSLDWKEINLAFDGKPNILRQHDGGVEPGQMALWLLDNPREFWQYNRPYDVDFLFIDGSHGISCGRDFLAWESSISENGVVVFHDYGEIEQGTDWQTVDREFINVRTYVHRLGLAKPCNVQRKGWQWLGEILGTRAQHPSINVVDTRSWWDRFKAALCNEPFALAVAPTPEGEGNSCAVVQRTQEPLEDNHELALGDVVIHEVKTSVGVTETVTAAPISVSVVIPAPQPEVKAEPEPEPVSVVKPLRVRRKVAPRRKKRG